jgi:hypothetical protein
MSFRLAVLAAAAALAAGCATQMPQTAEEFRKMAPGAFMVKAETYEVSRPLREVAETFRRRAPECLNVTVRTTSQTPGSYQVITTAYKPTVVSGAERAELHVQQNHLTGVMKVRKEPAGGYYLLVADAYPVDRGRTRIQILGPSRGYDVLWRAIRGWATGENLGCPDMTKIG